jgi:hypothetical protein
MVVLIYNNHIFNLIQKQIIIKFDIFLKLNIHELYRSVSTLVSDIMRISLTRHFLEPLRRKFISKCAFQGEINTNINTVSKIRNFCPPYCFSFVAMETKRSLTSVVLEARYFM